MADRPTAEKIGSQIRKLRRESDLTLSALAANSGVSKGYLWKLEKGDQEVRPSADTLLKIAKALGISMSALIGRSVLAEEPTETPRSLKNFAEGEGLRDGDIAMLAAINFRGKQPERPEDWAFIWSAIQRSVPAARAK
jgi:transcriptional regulator with XRE-family HTH domain